MIVSNPEYQGSFQHMTEAELQFSKGRRYLLLAQKKSQTEFRPLVQTGLKHFSNALQSEPRFDQWLTALSQLLQLLRLYPEETWLLEQMDELCQHFVEQVTPQPEDLRLLLDFLESLKQSARAGSLLRQRLMQLAEGFFHYMGSQHPVWNGELLHLRGQMLLEQALASTPTCGHHLQAACHSFLQARNWQPDNPRIHAALAQTLLYQAQTSPDNPAIFYHLAWNSLCAALRLREAALPPLEIPEIQLYALNQSLSLTEQLTLLRQLGERWFAYQQTPPAHRRFWLDQAQLGQYRQFLRIHHRCLLTQLEAQPTPGMALELFLQTWIEMLSGTAGPASALLAWLQLLQSLQKYLSSESLAACLPELGQILAESLEQGFAPPESYIQYFLPLLQSLLKHIDHAEFMALATGLYLPLADMLMQGWLDEESYHILWLDPLTERLSAVRRAPLLFTPLLQLLENAWMALIACSPDEHLIIDSHEALLDLLIRAPAKPFAQVLQMLRNLYTLLLSRHHCDYNLANLASYLQTLAEHRSGEEARALLLESCQTYAQACEIAEGDTELLMSWQNALRALASYDPEHAQELESEADGIYRQILELMYERS